MRSRFSPEKIGEWYVVTGFLFAIGSTAAARRAGTTLAFALINANFSVWYGTASLMTALLTAALAVVAFRNALSGQEVLGRFLDQ